MTLRAGEHAVVAVSVATLWASPDTVRPIDALALGTPPEVRHWVVGMSDEERQDEGPVLTQLLLGETVIVDEVRDHWARVVAPDQPAAKLDKRGYPGWLPAGQLAGPGGRAGNPLVVDATATALRDAPNGDVVIPGVMLGTRLVAIGEARRGWLPVDVPAGGGLWVRSEDVSLVPAEPPTQKDVLAVAERLIDVPYVWGGMSAYGIDCSGLVCLAHRRLGVTVPRDATDQAAATRPVPAGEERPGDLYFFARPGEPVHHVGLVAGERRMVHASAPAGRVLAEPLTGERLAMLAGIHRVLP